VRILPAAWTDPVRLLSFVFSEIAIETTPGPDPAAPEAIESHDDELLVVQAQLLPADTTTWNVLAAAGASYEVGDTL
jgi:hypothetical protein